MTGIRNCFLCVVICMSLLSSGTSVSLDDKVFHVALDGSNTIAMYWIVNYITKKITFEIHLPSNFGWFALGFSDRGEIFPADYCLLWYDWRRNVDLQDTYADEHGVVSLDEKQNCRYFKLIEFKNTIKYTFERDFDTCEPQDYVIEEGTTHVIWSRGRNTLYRANGLNISTTNENHGMVRVTLLKNTKPIKPLPSHVFTLDIVVNKTQIPAEETTYWCHIYKLPDSFVNKHHVYQYESVISNQSQGVVHHMEVFHCEAPVNEKIPTYQGSCFAPQRPKKTELCKRVLAAWAMGATAFSYPEEAGLPIGGKDFNPYIMLEVHYNNPEKIGGLIDSSGIRFHVSSKLRRYDAGILEAGLEYTDKMAIPPGQEDFPLSGYCVSECTAVSLPPEGITIFGSQLHTHLTGTRVYTKHIRNGRELRELNRDNHFSTHFQEIRLLKKPVLILPGDALITTCDYDTKDRENVTLGGFAISDEMCVNYMHYYPVTELEVCKSAISDQALQTFFRYMKEWENQDTSTKKGISSNYQAIEWNRMRVQLLKEVYAESPLSMQCNMSSGDRFPGYWENTPVTPVLLPLPPPIRQCANKVF